ncbi:MAG: hypothetical protein N2595_04840 [bacterium]|nr:hypothetical protein [bacterium]
MGLVAFVLWRGRTYDPAFFRPPNGEARHQGLTLPSVLGSWRASAPAWFPRERMYEKIDGRDVLFLQYGAESLQCITWRGSTTWDLYLYTLTTPAGARGVWLAEKPKGATVLPDGATWSAPGAAATHCGRFYVYLSSASAQPSLVEATNLLSLVCQHLPTFGSTTSDPATLLPEDGLQEGSREFLPSAAFGFQALENVHAARYEHAGAQATWFVIRERDPAAAAARVAQYAREFSQFGGSQIYRYVDGFSGLMLDLWERIAHTNALIVGVREAESFESLTQHWALLQDHLGGHLYGEAEKRP